MVNGLFVDWPTFSCLQAVLFKWCNSQPCHAKHQSQFFGVPFYCNTLVSLSNTQHCLCYPETCNRLSCFLVKKKKTPNYGCSVFASWCELTRPIVGKPQAVISPRGSGRGAGGGGRALLSRALTYHTTYSSKCVPKGQRTQLCCLIPQMHMPTDVPVNDQWVFQVFCFVYEETIWLLCNSSYSVRFSKETSRICIIHDWT